MLDDTGPDPELRFDSRDPPTAAHIPVAHVCAFSVEAELTHALTATAQRLVMPVLPTVLRDVESAQPPLHASRAWRHRHMGKPQRFTGANHLLADR